MTQTSRRRKLIEAIHIAATKLANYADAAGYSPPQLAPKPTPDEIDALAERLPITPGTNTDELWSAAALSPDGVRHWGLGRTPGEAKACGWAYSHWTEGRETVTLEISSEVPDGWTFEVYPPPRPHSLMFPIGSPAIFELVQLTIPDVTLDEIEDTIVRCLPHMGGSRH